MFEISLTSCHFTPRYAYIFTRLAVKTSRPQYVKDAISILAKNIPDNLCNSMQFRLAVL